MAGRHLDIFLCYSMISTLVSSDIRNNDYGWLLFAFATKTLLSYPSTDLRGRKLVCNHLTQRGCLILELGASPSLAA
jgi:hypothetical protein